MLTLGLHPVVLGRRRGHVIRAYHPEARRIDLLVDGESFELDSLGDGVFAGWREGREPFVYQLVLHFEDTSSWQCHDPYRFAPTLGELDLHLLGAGRHYRAWERLGAVPTTELGVEGFAFAVWAPNARRVSVVGDFCHWDGRPFPMRRLGQSGIFELFVPGLGSGEVYKYEILDANGRVRLKADPYARWSQAPAGNRVTHLRRSSPMDRR